MAGTVTMQIVAKVVNGNFKSEFGPYGVLTFSQTNEGAHRPVVNVGTSEEDLSLGDLSTAGFVAMRSLNTNTSNYVKYGPKSGTAMVEYARLRANEIHVLRLAPGITHRWIATNATQNVEIWALEA